MPALSVARFTNPFTLAFCIALSPSCGGSANLSSSGTVSASGSGGVAFGSEAIAGTGGVLPTPHTCANAIALAPGAPTCRNDQDCAGLGRCESPVAPDIGCPGADMSTCELDADCSGGMVCLRASECEPALCAPRCAATSCGPDEQCASSGHCVPASCSNGYVCPSGSDCAQAPGMDAHGCNVPRCDQSALACPTNTRCNPNSTAPNGCAALACARDSDCDCGACVFGACQSQLFECVAQLL